MSENNDIITIKYHNEVYDMFKNYLNNLKPNPCVKYDSWENELTKFQKGITQYKNTLSTWFETNKDNVSYDDVWNSIYLYKEIYCDRATMMAAYYYAHKKKHCNYHMITKNDGMYPTFCIWLILQLTINYQNNDKNYNYVKEQIKNNNFRVQLTYIHGKNNVHIYEYSNVFYTMLFYINRCHDNKLNKKYALNESIKTKFTEIANIIKSNIEQICKKNKNYNSKIFEVRNIFKYSDQMKNNQKKADKLINLFIRHNNKTIHIFFIFYILQNYICFHMHEHT